MFIKTIVLDGFKSYGRRVLINDLDPEFTAITGLNGTGKSNILDGICFVLGITNLGQVRAGSMQELVYKNGQAGITRASVTLIFDNTDPNQCPLGYERCDEISVTRRIVVGGKNKYFINEKSVQNKKIADFFCSVQLNVNNPNFLIMQGRITKVLNMKPHEILSMIEEAAGTSMYETKREATNRLIEKKDAKVRETNTLLQEEVEPRLEKLRNERVAYQEFQKICRDIEYLTRIHISFRYLKEKEAIKSIEENIGKLTECIAKCRSTIAKNDAECERIDEANKNLQLQIDEESGGGVLKLLENELSKALQKEATASGNLKAAQGCIDQEAKKLAALTKNIADDKREQQQKEAQMDKVQGRFQSLKAADEQDSAAYEEAQRKFEAVTQGLLSTNDEGQASSLQDQLIHAKQQISEAKTTIKTSDMELRHCRTVLSQKQNEKQTKDAAYKKDKHQHDQLEKEIGNLRRQLEGINYEDGAFEKLQERNNELNASIRQLKQQLDRQNAYRFELRYSDPVPNFDRSKVRGMVGKLFTVRDDRHCMALMMTAGRSLYSHVTDDDVTSKLILQKGELQQRVTIIPINQISAKRLNQRSVDFAKSLVGEENVDLALALIDYDPYFEPVMQFVFGNTLVCRDMNIAKKVTFHRNVHCRTVTLDGDIVDPEGTLTGGAIPKGGNVLKELAEIRRLEDISNSRKDELLRVEEESNSMKSLAHSYNQIKEKLEMRQHELNACKQRLAQSTFQQHQEEIQSLKERIETLEDALTKARVVEQTAHLKVKDIEAKLSDTDGYRKRELKAAGEALAKTKEKAVESRNEWRKREQEIETLQLEIEELRNGIETAMEQRDALEAKMTQIKADFELLRQSSFKMTENVADLKRRIKEMKDKLNEKCKELREQLIKMGKLQKRNQDMALEIKKKENEVVKVSNDSEESFDRIESWEEKYEWILEDREFFGTKNTRYDYAKEDPVEAGRKLDAMRAKKDKMERHINMRAMVLLEREEEQYQEAMRRKLIVERDKEKIKDIICRMDEKKRQTVQSAWKVVDENFGGIFSSLLPSAQARLKPVMKGNHLTGLEIQVGFNGVWKETLDELSGGQRSLVALSLVLAMLKFSPAPLYILDEVDAALDMAHTQNIGNMLKMHFTNSQFIIVSLKDGMFNNANVLLRTKFEEGVSVVTRTDNPARHKRTSN